MSAWFHSGRMPAVVLCAAAGFLLLAAEPALAFRCGNKIVTQGDHSSRVRQICGEPTGIQERVIYREGRTRPRPRLLGPDGRWSDDEVLQYDRSYVEIVVEEWTYNFGPQRFMRLVRFENGFVAKVTQLGYGYRE